MMEELTDLEEEAESSEDEIIEIFEEVIEFEPYDADEKELFDYLKPRKQNCSENHLQEEISEIFEEVMEFEPYNADEKEFFDYLKPRKLNCSENHVHNDSLFDEIRSSNDSQFDDKSHLHKDFSADELNDFSAIEVKYEKPHIDTDSNWSHSCNDSPFDDKTHLHKDSSSDEHNDFSAVEVKDEKPDINTEDLLEAKIKPVIEHVSTIELDAFKNEDDGELNEFKNEDNEELNEFKNEGDGELNEFKNECDGELNEFKNEDDGDSLGSLTINDHWLGFGSLSSPEQLSGELPNVLRSVTVKSEDDENEEDTSNADNQLTMKQPAVLTIQPEEDCEELSFPGNLATTSVEPIHPIRVVNAISNKGNGLSRDRPLRRKMTSPVITARNQCDHKIKVIIPKEFAHIEVEGTPPKRCKVNDSNDNMMNRVQSNSKSLNLKFTQECVQNATWRGKNFVEKQIQEFCPADKKVGKSNTMVISGNECTTQPVAIPVNVVKPLTPNISKIKRILPKPPPIDNNFEHITPKSSGVQIINNSPNVTPDCGKSKNSKLIHRLKVGDSLLEEQSLKVEDRLLKEQRLKMGHNLLKELSLKVCHSLLKEQRLKVDDRLLKELRLKMEDSLFKELRLKMEDSLLKEQRLKMDDSLLKELRLKVGDSLLKDRPELEKCSTSNLNYLEYEKEQIKSTLAASKANRNQLPCIPIAQKPSEKSQPSCMIVTVLKPISIATKPSEKSQPSCMIEKGLKPIPIAPKPLMPTCTIRDPLRPIPIAPKPSIPSQPTCMMGNPILPMYNLQLSVPAATPVVLISQLPMNSQTLKDLRPQTYCHSKKRS